MKKILFSILSLIFGGTSVYADIIVKLPQDCNTGDIDYYYAPIKQYAEAKTRAERGLVIDSIKITDSNARIIIPDNGKAYMCGLTYSNSDYGTPNILVFINSGEDINLNYLSFHPFAYSLSGTTLADSMNEMAQQNSEFYAKIEELYAKGEEAAPEINELENQHIGFVKNFISSNPATPAAPVALLELEGEDFIDMYRLIGDRMNSSILSPLVERQYNIEQKGLEAQKKQQALESGQVEAPNFTLKDLEGKDVSLTDFRGKWIILDFWGSWCPWCIKGFPELKEAYQKYTGKLEIIGIDCNESEADWKSGVEKYDLPWVQVYNPQGSTLTEEYAVQGFPTKAIIDPAGKIRNITVGHNPQFFMILSELMGE